MLQDFASDRPTVDEQDVLEVDRSPNDSGREATATRTNLDRGPASPTPHLVYSAHHGCREGRWNRVPGRANPIADADTRNVGPNRVETLNQRDLRNREATIPALTFVKKMSLLRVPRPCSTHRTRGFVPRLGSMLRIERHRATPEGTGERHIVSFNNHGLRTNTEVAVRLFGRLRNRSHLVLIQH
jgi:hypothetical protein